MTQTVKNLPAIRRPGIYLWVWKIPWRREWLPTPVFFPREFHGQRSLVGYCPWGHKESASTERLIRSLSLLYYSIGLYSPGGSDGKESACSVGDLGSIPESGRSSGEGNGNPLQYSCLGNPMEWRAWQATVHGVAKSRTWLSSFTYICDTIIQGFPGGASGKETTRQCRRKSKKRQPVALVILPRGLCEQKSLAGNSPCGCKELDMTKSLSWRRQWRPIPVLLPGKFHGQRSLVACSPWGRWESNTTEQLHFHFSPSCIGEGNGTPLQCSCLEDPRDGAACWAAVYGVTQQQEPEYMHYTIYHV